MASTYPAARLKKIDATILVNASGGTTNQAPSSGAVANVYLAGCDVRATSSLASGASGSVHVQEVGQTRIGDVLQIGTATSPTATVTAIVQNNDLTWTLTCTIAGGPWNPSVGNRLINTSRRPTPYAERGGRTQSGGVCTISGYTVTATTAGLIRFFTRAKHVDMVISGGTPAVTTYVIPDEDGGEPDLVFNLQEYGGMAEVLDAIDTNTWLDDLGAEIYIPAGNYTIDYTEMPYVIPSRVKIHGDGPEATTLVVDGFAASKDVDLFHFENGVTMESLGIRYDYSAAAGTGIAIRVGQTGGSGFLHTKIHHVYITDSPSWAVEIGSSPPSGTDSNDHVLIDRCRFQNSQSNGLVWVGNSSTMVQIRKTRLHQHGTSTTGGTAPTGSFCLKVSASAQVEAIQCEFKPPDLNTPAVKTFYDTTGSSQPRYYGAQLVIDRCDLEYVAGVTTETTPMIYVEGMSGVVVRDSIIYQMGSGIYLNKCYGARLEGVLIKARGGSGYDVKIEDCYSTVVNNCFRESDDGATNKGFRSPVVLTYAGSYAGTSNLGAGLMIPVYASDAERDTAPGSGVDDPRASTAAGTMIYVITPTAPASHLQIYHGGAWVGIAKWTGAAAAAI